MHPASGDSLRVPRSYPKRLLYCPLLRGGFGVPHLLHRLDNRFLLGTLAALNSRNALVRLATRALLREPLLERVREHDVSYFQRGLDQMGATLSIPPHDLLLPLHHLAAVRRPYSGGPVILVSDGSAPEGRLGWGALVADEHGILATTRAGIPVTDASSWAAEWHGKLAAVRLAEDLEIPPAMWAWSVADNVSAMLGEDGGRPSRSHYLDNVRLPQVRRGYHPTPPSPLAVVCTRWGIQTSNGPSGPARMSSLPSQCKRTPP
jgi:hypothetical protein